LVLVSAAFFNVAAGNLLGHVPYVGHLFISAIQPSTQLVRGATIKRRKSQKSVQWWSKVMGNNRRWRKSMRNPSWSLWGLATGIERWRARACSQRRRWITELDRRLSRGGHRQLAPPVGHDRNRHTCKL